MSCAHAKRDCRSSCYTYHAECDLAAAVIVVAVTDFTKPWYKWECSCTSDGIESQARRKAVLFLTVDDDMSYTEQTLQTGVKLHVCTQDGQVSEQTELLKVQQSSTSIMKGSWRGHWKPGERARSSESVSVMS